jgi:YD repeat-containing protein
MPSETYNYDSDGRLTSIFYEDGARTIYNYDSLGNRITTYEVPECCSPRFIILEKGGNFEASDGAGVYYRITASATVTLPASPADGGVYKFKVIAGTSTFAFDGAETINHANGDSDQDLVLTARSGVIELIAVEDGWDET